MGRPFFRVDLFLGSTLWVELFLGSTFFWGRPLRVDSTRRLSGRPIGSTKNTKYLEYNHDDGINNRVEYLNEELLWRSGSSD